MNNSGSTMQWPNDYVGFFSMTGVVEPDGATAGMAGQQTLFSFGDPIPRVTPMAATLEAPKEGPGSVGTMASLLHPLDAAKSVVQEAAGYGGLALLGVLLIVAGGYVLLNG